MYNPALYFGITLIYTFPETNLPQSGAAMNFESLAARTSDLTQRLLKSA